MSHRTDPAAIRSTGWAAGLLKSTLLVAGLMLLGWTLYSQRDALTAVLQHSWDWRLFAAAVCCKLLCEFGVALRWYFLVQAVASVPWSTAWRWSMLGFLSSAVLPGAITGDVVKAGLIVSSPTQRTLLLASLVLDRLIGLLGLLILASLAAGAAWSTIDDSARPLFVWLWGATASAAVLCLGLFQPSTVQMMRRCAWIGPLAPTLDQLAAGAVLFGSAWRRMAGALGVAIASHLANIAGFYLVGRMLFPASSASLLEHLVLVPIILAASALPLPGGGVGFVEQISQELFRWLGHPNGALEMLAFRGVHLATVGVALAVYAIAGPHPLRLVKQPPRRPEEPE